MAGTLTVACRYPWQERVCGMSGLSVPSWALNHGGLYSLAAVTGGRPSAGSSHLGHSVGVSPFNFVREPGRV